MIVCNKKLSIQIFIHLIFTNFKMQHKFITIEGNIGAGKTTLSHLLQKQLQAKLILEQFAENPFLPKFYEDKEKYAFPLELSFLADRYKQLKSLLLNRDLFSEYIISDYLFIKSKMFAKVNLNEDEYQLYETMFDIIYPNLPEPDIVIYLYAPISKLQENIKNRNRTYEQKIPEEYLHNLHEAYQTLLLNGDYKTLIVDTTTTDFLNNKNDFDKLLKYLENDYPKGNTYLSF